MPPKPRGQRVRREVELLVEPSALHGDNTFPTVSDTPT
eukprot:COSAG02_NODE_6132_length_3778_cov_194.586794_2_plen_38_part_00